MPRLRRPARQPARRDFEIEVGFLLRARSISEAKAIVRNLIIKSDTFPMIDGFRLTEDGEIYNEF